MDCVQQTLNDAKLAPRQIDKVVLVGGSTRTPMVARLLEERLGQPAHCEVNPDLVVAMGAAIQAGIIAGEDVGAVLVDITPHSLGIRCLDYRDESGLTVAPFQFRFAPIIRRNTPLPASRSEVFSTVADRQPVVQVDVYQGENNDVRRNHLAGHFTVEGLAQVPAGNQLLVQLDLDLNGMLRVSAREKATGLQKQITIQNALARIAGETEAARSRLDRFWAPPGQVMDEDEQWDEMMAGIDGEDDDARAEREMPELAPAPREGQRESVQARALLEKAERIREKATPEDQVELDKLTERVRINLTDRKWEVVGKSCDELADVLFYLEDV
jgi:molecular chaperone DnaK